nr:uncharacterized protein LOC128685992 [Cherax quadricarinatus]
MLSVAMSECFYSLINKLQVPYVHVSPNMLHESMSDLAGNPKFPSIEGNYLLDLGYPLTFIGRIISTLSQLMYNVINMHYVIPKMAVESEVDAATLREVRLNGSLIIVNRYSELLVF